MTARAKNKLQEQAARLKSVGQAFVEDRFAAADRMVTAHPDGMLAPAVAQAGSVVLVVDIDLVDDNPENSRQSLGGPEEFEKLVSLLAAQGQLEPAQAMRNPATPGRWVLESGHRRKRALLRLGRKTIDVIEVPWCDGIERYKRSTAHNEQAPETTYDNARAWQQLLDAGHVRDQDDLASKLGLAPSTVSKTLAINKLPADALERIAKNPARFGPTTCLLLAQIAATRTGGALLEIIDQVAAGQMTVRKLQGHAKAPAKQRAAKAHSRQYPVRGGGVASGMLREWDDGRVVLEVKMSTAKARQDLVDLLRKRYAAEGG